MPSDSVPHDDYAAGYKVGCQAIMGTGVPLPPMPPKLITILGMTPFLMGVRAGLETAGVQLEDY